MEKERLLIGGGLRDALGDLDDERREACGGEVDFLVRGHGPDETVGCGGDRGLEAVDCLG